MIVNLWYVVVALIAGVVIFAFIRSFAGSNDYRAGRKLREGPNSPSSYSDYKIVQRAFDNGWQIVAQKTQQRCSQFGFRTNLETEYAIMSKPVGGTLSEANASVFTFFSDAKAFYDLPYTASPVNKVYFINLSGAKYSDVYVVDQGQK